MTGTTEPIKRDVSNMYIANNIISAQEHLFSSTGHKFWYHQNAMESLRNKSGRTIISTHISPTSMCNLKCSYCSSSSRELYNTIPLPVIKDYIVKLKSRGLKAVILTGGGEPTSYGQIDELLDFLFCEGLKVALITNGTQTDRIDPVFWKKFTWVRVSLNLIENWQTRIKIPIIKGDLGCSMIYTKQTIEQMREIQKFIKGRNVRYVRVQPNIVQDFETLIEDHEKVHNILAELNDQRFFHQKKLYQKVQSSICYQSYFRPYLSEVGGGTIFTCDSVVHNSDSLRCYSKKHFGICNAEDILDFLDGKIKPSFQPCKDCRCVYSDTIDMLDNWFETGFGCFNTLISDHDYFV